MDFLKTEIEEIMHRMEEQMKICPKCGTKQPLDKIWIQKKIWKGKYSPENTAELCPACDEDYRLFVQGLNGRFETLKTIEDFRKVFEQFLGSVRPEMTTAEQSMQILRKLAGLRVELQIENQKFLGRFRSRSQRLDEIYPITQSVFWKRIVEEFGEEAKNINWQKFLMSQVAGVKTVKSVLEKEIAKQVRYYPVWNMYARHIPGIGEWLTGYLIAAIRDPRRFSGTGKLWGNAGLRVDKDGFAQRPAHGKQLNYDPTLKAVLCNILPQSLLYQSGRFPYSPYSLLYERIRLKEQEKATSAHPAKCRIKGCDETEIVNLGFRDDPERGKVFRGFCCAKSLHTLHPHLFFNPAHLHQRAMREVGKKFYADFYHAWLYLIGENPDIYGKEGEHDANKRILWVFGQALKAQTGA